jgi:DNA-binding transcriptional MerR regulator
MAAGERSIGEALAELRKEFPDVTVSKIRFLESQGLVSPARTASGYRQFSDDDVARLRWILLQQRENYLPLKVIRRKLKVSARPWEETEEAEAPERPEAAEAAPVVTAPEETPELPEPEPEPEPARTYSRTELAAAAGLDEKRLDELHSFGLLPDPLDEGALTVARAAARFFAHGVEARHLRMYRSFAERESGFLAQVVAPIGGPRGENTAEARRVTADLLAAGGELREALVRHALRSQPG